ncbi:dolichol phosphate-mannose biosynthesis regulatory [Auriculariales sp. MPI-PUGE-AT-0066]|nr:dolichol phosphate-mannose biosynthesis regulatory [Auriculariales sp. MPI-PUGE-AT-0066]
MAVSDKALGSLMLLVASVVFVYYTVWALVLPLIPQDNSIHDYFPAREWAVRIPAIILFLGLSAVGAFVSMVMVKEGQKRKAKLAAVKTQ